jgi:hypothetical protein
MGTSNSSCLNCDQTQDSNNIMIESTGKKRLKFIQSQSTKSA